MVYLGQKINTEGLHPLSEKVETIVVTAAPRNVGELRTAVILWEVPTQLLINSFTIVQVAEDHCQVVMN